MHDTLHRSKTRTLQDIPQPLEVDEKRSIVDSRFYWISRREEDRGMYNRFLPFKGSDDLVVVGNIGVYDVAIVFESPALW